MDRTDSSRNDLTRRVGALVLVVGLFGVALLLSWAVSAVAGALFPVGDPGTVSRLLVGVVALQVVGFGVGATALLWTRDRAPRSYLRLDGVSVWTVYYGTATGLTLMVVASLATVVFTLLGLDPAESAVGAATDPVFYLVLFAVSTFVAVPMEELFFRGVGYYRTENLFVPVIGHALYNGIQVLLRTVEVVA